MAPRPRLRAFVLVAALSSAVVACGDDAGGTATTSTTSTSTTSTSTTSTTGPPATSTTEADVADDEEGLGELESLVPQLLIEASELGADVEAVGYRLPVGVDCGIDDDHATDVHAGTELQSPGEQIEEAIRVYPGTDAAAAAFEAWTGSAPTCTFGLGVAMGAPTDGGEAIGADRSVRYTATVDGATTTLVVALVGDALITVSVHDTGTPSVDPIEVAAFAVGKVLAALEA